MIAIWNIRLRILLTVLYVIIGTVSLRIAWQPLGPIKRARLEHRTFQLSFRWLVNKNFSGGILGSTHTHIDPATNQTHMLFLNLLLSQLYIPRWALASFTISRHVFLSCAFSFHLPILIRLRSSFTSWSHLFLGLPLLWTPNSSPFNKHFRVLSLSTRSTWPTQINLRNFECLTMSSSWSKLLISKLDLTLQTPSSHTGP
jgi:hypothetical protein